MRHSRSSGLAAAILLAMETVPAGAPTNHPILRSPTSPIRQAIPRHQGCGGGSGEIQEREQFAAFATDMVRDHKAVNDKALALVKKLNVTPEDNDTSKGLVNQGQRKGC